MADGGYLVENTESKILCYFHSVPLALSAQQVKTLIVGVVFSTYSNVVQVLLYCCSVKAAKTCLKINTVLILVRTIKKKTKTQGFEEYEKKTKYTQSNAQYIMNKFNYFCYSV